LALVEASPPLRTTKSTTNFQRTKPFDEPIWGSNCVGAKRSPCRSGHPAASMLL
jgi:hypothetical protein